MWTRRSFSTAILTVAGVHAQAGRPATITIPNGVPLSLWSSDFKASSVGESFAELRGKVEFRNEGSQPIRAVALAVATPPGAKPTASILLPSLDAARGESFIAPVRLRLAGTTINGPWAEVSVDGCLTADLAFTGPDQRNSRRRLIVSELEARRERARLRTILGVSGQSGLASELTRLERGRRSRPPAAASAAGGARVEAAVIGISDSPLEIVSASALVSETVAGNPAAVVRNRSATAIRSFELGWAMTEREGGRTFGGSIGSSPGLLPPRGEAKASSTAGRPAPEGSTLSGIVVYVRNVELADGRFWLPSAAALETADIHRVEPLATEVLRIISLKDREGIAAAARAVEKE